MPRPLYNFFAQDHKRLEDLLNRAVANPAKIDLIEYGKFRSGLLKHISMEEKILLPAIQRWRGGKPLPIAARLRLDHGALAALLVPSPDLTIITALRAILSNHNVLEEEPGGMYEVGEQLAGSEVGTLLAKLREMPDVPVAPHVNKPKVLEATQRALARAGYNLNNYKVEQ